MKKQKKITLIINKEKFTNWYFDSDTCECLSESMIDELKDKGKIEYTLKDILLNAGYLPYDVIKNTEDIINEAKYIDEADEPDIENLDDYNLIFDYEVKKKKGGNEKENEKTR